MAPTDRFEHPLTTAAAGAAADYVAALDLMLSGNPGAEALLDRALGADPDFALAHVTRARLYQVQARGAEAREAAAAARTLAARTTPREQRHIETVALAVEGAGPRAMALLEEHVAEYPRDAAVLSLALGVYGLLGFSGRRDHHEAQFALLQRLAPKWPEDWWFLTYLGWARIELGDIAAGAREVDRALELKRDNGYAAHARAHGYYEAGDAENGAAFVATWLPDYDRHGILHGHIAWHLALFEMARGHAGRAAELYRDAVCLSASHAPPLFSLADAASFLWRWQIYGETAPLADTWDQVAAYATRHFPRAGVHFADLHAAMAEAASGADAAAVERAAQCRARLADGKLPQGAVVPDLCAGIAAFARGDYAGAVKSFDPALPELDRVGGSHAQREVFEDTYLVACLRAGERAKAAARLNRRLARRPSARDSKWLASLS